MNKFTFLHLPVRFTTSLTVLGVTMASALTAHATPLIDVVNAPFTNNPSDYTYTGTMSGAGVLQSNTNSAATPDQWNQFPGGNTQNYSLSNTSGVATGVTLSSSFGGHNFSGQDSVDKFDTAIFENFDYSFGNASLQLKGLADNTQYYLVLYSTNNNGGNDITYTINGVKTTLIESGHDGFSSEQTTSAVDSGTVYTGNYVQLIAGSSATGELDISFAIAPSNTSNGGKSEYINFNGLQLEATPEPSSMVLSAAGLGGLAWLVYRRRALAPQA